AGGGGGAGEAIEGAEVRFQRVGRQAAQDIAAPLVHVCHVRVLRHDAGDHALVAVAVPVAGDRGGDQLHADARRVGVVEVGPQVGGVVDVRVPGEHDRIGRARVDRK